VSRGPDPKPIVSIIIVNWNGRHHLSDCLDSLGAQSFRDFEVVLVDNGSNDGSISFVTENYPWVRRVPLPENTGFATGNNRGLEQARGNYIVTLNNDTRVDPDWLAILVGVADSHPRAGMVASRVCSFTDPDLIDSIGMGICRDGMARGRFRNKRWSAMHLGEMEDILIPSACAALYKRAMIEETGFFDDEFFAYAEDVDLGLRGRLAGWKAIAATAGIVYHKYSQTSGVLSPFKVYLVERNHYWVALKSFPLSHLAVLPWFTLWRFCEQARAVLAGGGTGGEFRTGTSPGGLIRAVIKGVWDGLRGIPAVLRKRRRVMKNRRLTMRELAQLLRRYRMTLRELLDFV
jgi:GT2 family glycosyltransferase